MNKIKLENQTVTTCSYEETEAFGKALAESLPSGSVVAMYGTLGAGKTVMARGFAKGLGIEEAVSSPHIPLCRSTIYPTAARRFITLTSTGSRTKIRRWGLVWMSF